VIYIPHISHSFKNQRSLLTMPRIQLTHKLSCLKPSKSWNIWVEIQIHSNVENTSS